MDTHTAAALCIEGPLGRLAAGQAALHVLGSDREKALT